MPVRAMLHTLLQSEAENPAPSSSSTLGLRIGAIFIILVASLLGSVPPLFLQAFRRGSSSPVALLVRAFSAGVLLALALVHILPDGYADMDALGVGDDYPIGGVTAVFGVMIIILMENIAHAFSRRNSGGGGCHSHGPAASPLGGESHLHLEVVDQKPQGVVPVHDHHHGPHDHHASHDNHEDVNDMKHHVPAVALGTPTSGISGGNADGADHAHGCVSGLRASSAVAWFRLPTVDPKDFAEVRRFQVVALVMEMGCVFHSVLIGITLGVTIDPMSTVRALTIALVFHQGLEGLSLGSVIARADFTLLKSVSMAVLYSLTTPIGIIIGICISSTYDPESVTAFAVQGTLNCVSGGLLLYIALVQLVAEDFSREDLLAPGAWRLRIGTYSLLMLGAASMCLLAVWA